MSRPPYPARVAAGLVAATLEETRKLPTRVITFPMSAVSLGLQAGMRLQQNIAELAIKGDELLAPLCEKTQEQPQWAHFDEDDAPAEAPQPLRADAPRVVVPAADSAGLEAPAPAEDSVAEAAAADTTTTADAAATETNGTAETNGTGAAAPGSGRFALYSAAPADLTAGATSSQPGEADGRPLPPAVAALDYPNLTLAQLRAKVRGLSADDLTEVLAFEKAGRNRTPFVTMLDNRLASQQKKSESAQ